MCNVILLLNACAMQVTRICEKKKKKKKKKEKTPLVSVWTKMLSLVRRYVAWMLSLLLGS